MLTWTQVSSGSQADHTCLCYCQCFLWPYNVSGLRPWFSRKEWSSVLMLTSVYGASLSSERKSVAPPCWLDLSLTGNNVPSVFHQWLQVAIFPTFMKSYKSFTNILIVFFKIEAELLCYQSGGDLSVLQKCVIDIVLRDMHNLLLFHPLLQHVFSLSFPSVPRYYEAFSKSWGRQRLANVITPISIIPMPFIYPLKRHTRPPIPPLHSAVFSYLTGICPHKQSEVCKVFYLFCVT